MERPADQSIGDAVNIADVADDVSDELLLSLIASFPATAATPTLLHHSLASSSPALSPAVVVRVARLCPPVHLETCDDKNRIPLAIGIARRNESPTSFKSFPDSLLIALQPPYLSMRRYVNYDTSDGSPAFLLRDVLYRIIEPSLSSPCQLGTLHTLPKAQQLLSLHQDPSLRPAHAGRMIYNRRYRSADLAALGFRSALGLFVQSVIAPLLYPGGPDPPGVVVYQAEPTLRVQFPGQPSLGKGHVDYSYGRQAAEVNCWLPITLVGPGNTLRAETRPGMKDFEAFEADFGKAVLFWGSQCEHHSEENDGKIGTRVSMDFRLMREDHFLKYYVPPNRLLDLGEVENEHFANMKLGGHYTSTAIEKTWRESTGAPAVAETPPPPPMKGAEEDIDVEVPDAKQCALS